MMNKEMISRIARYCATSGAQNTTDGRWSITYDELSHHFGVDKNDINGNAQLLADALESRWYDRSHTLTEAEKMVEDYNDGNTILNDDCLAFVDAGQSFGM